MTVYVDAAKHPYRRMLMSHMMAESLDELHAMADRIGINRKWFQSSVRHPHYDVCQEKRALAIETGAVVVDSRDLVRMAREWRRRDPTQVLVRVVAPHFVAGLLMTGDFCTDAAPILRWAVGRTRQDLRVIFEYRGYRASVLQPKPAAAEAVPLRKSCVGPA